MEGFILAKKEDKRRAQYSNLQRLYQGVLDSDGRTSELPRIPTTREQTELRIALEKAQAELAVVANDEIVDTFGVDAAELLSVPDGYTFGDIPEGYPKQKRNIKHVFPISLSEIRKRTQPTDEAKLYPFYRDGNKINFIGLDTKTNRSCLFAVVFDEGNSVESANSKLVVYMGGSEEGLQNIERPTYKPSSYHEDVVRSGGEIATKKGIAQKKAVDPVGSELHVYSLRDRLMDPHGYSATVETVNEGCATIQTGNKRVAVTTPRLKGSGSKVVKPKFYDKKAVFLKGEIGKLTQTPPTHLKVYQYVDHFDAFCERNGLAHAPIPTYLRSDVYGKQLDNYFPQELMFLEDKETLEAFADEPFAPAATYHFIKSHFEQKLVEYKSRYDERDFDLPPDELYLDGSQGGQAHNVPADLYVEVTDKTMLLPDDIRKADTVKPDGTIVPYDYSSSKDKTPEQ